MHEYLPQPLHKWHDLRDFTVFSEKTPKIPLSFYGIPSLFNPEKTDLLYPSFWCWSVTGHHANYSRV
jgi:hypothetical protein